MSVTLNVRKYSTTVECVLHDGGPVLDEPLKQGAAMAVVRNPFAGSYVQQIEWFMDELRPLAKEMALSLVQAIAGGDARRILTYGKGAIVGTDGELEHGALWHNPGGMGMREVLGEARAIVPSNKIVAPIGARLLIPTCHINASSMRSHFNSYEVGIHDAPRAAEIVFALVMGTGPRAHARVGGLRPEQVQGMDGVR